MNNTKNNFGLSDHDIQLMQSVFQNYSEIEKVIIYGSRAKGNYKIGSDIDLTIVSPQMSFNNLLKIDNELDDLYLPYKIDLSLLHQIENLNLVEHIQRVGKIFYIKSGK